jgi:hypothetical protein
MIEPGFAVAVGIVLPVVNQPELILLGVHIDADEDANAADQSLRIAAVLATLFARGDWRKPGRRTWATHEEHYPGRFEIWPLNSQWAMGNGQDVTERYLPKMRLFAQGAMTNVGILHEPGHAEPWYPGSSAVCEV